MLNIKYIQVQLLMVVRFIFETIYLLSKLKSIQWLYICMCAWMEYVCPMNFFRWHTFLCTMCIIRYSVKWCTCTYTDKNQWMEKCPLIFLLFTPTTYAFIQFYVFYFVDHIAYLIHIQSSMHVNGKTAK